MVIVQTKVLRDSRRSLLEDFLSNFLPEVQQTLEVNPRNFDPKYLSLLKRLETATMKKEIVETMLRENLLQQELDGLVAALEKAKKDAETERKQTEIARKQAEGEKELRELEQKKAIELLRISVRTFSELGMPAEAIAEKLNISILEVNRLLS